MKTFSTKEFFNFVKAQPDDRPVRSNEGKPEAPIGCYLIHFAKHKELKFSGTSFRYIYYSEKEDPPFHMASESRISPDEDEQMIWEFTSHGYLKSPAPEPSMTYGEAKQYIPDKYK